MNLNFVDSIVGWSTGYQYAKFKSKEDEVKQGKNYYLAAPALSGQVGQLGTVVDKVNALCPKTFLTLPVKILTNIVPLLSLPVTLLFASVKQGHYEMVSTTCNCLLDRKASWLPVRLPEALGRRTVKVANFLTEKGGDMLRVGMIVGSVALIALGNLYFGGSCLLALSYETVDRMGLVPRKISLFMERHMPIVSTIGIVIGGTLVLRIFSFVMLATHVFPSVNRYIHQKLDLFIHKHYNKNSPTLEEIDAPIVVNKSLTFGAINAILDASAWSFSGDYKINPAHCSKPITSISEFPVSKNFDQFLVFFNQVDWVNKYAILSPRLKDDEIFMEFLQEKFPEVSKELLKNNFNRYVAEVAAQEGKTEAQFAAKWVREQMEILTFVLKGDLRVKGQQTDLDTAIKNFSILLPYLESIQNVDPIEFENILMKLAVEGGNYCARGLKRVSFELVNHPFQRGLQRQGVELDAEKNYELKIERSLQDMRMALIQKFYQNIVQALQIPGAISQDVHGFDTYRINLSLGFSPLTDIERNDLGITQILMWERFAELRDPMFVDYLDGLDGAIRENGEQHFFNYIQRVINTNPNLSVEQREQIIEKYTERNDGNWSYETTIKKFHRLMFVMLGVLKAA